MPVRFSVPEALIQQLHAPRKPLSTVELVNEGASGEDSAHLAKSFVNDMNALQSLVNDDVRVQPLRDFPMVIQKSQSNITTQD